MVRHPGYLGTSLITTGSILMLLGPGSWWNESNVTGSAIRGILGAAYASIWASVTYMLLARMNQEDEVLRNEFGSSWQAWARQTPYQLIPFVY